MSRPVERFESRGGTRLYRIPLDLFPELEGYAHVIVSSGMVALWDVGSGFGNANEQLEAGLEEIRSRYREEVSWDNLTHIFLSHGHIDHFGGLAHVRELSKAPVFIHELDRRVLARYEERLALIARRLRAFLVEAGVPKEEGEGIMALYMLNKGLFSSQRVDATYGDVNMAVGPMRFLHVPGHCPGQVVALIDDILLSADHVLEHTSPHQSPERLSLNTGLGHYFESLRRLCPLAPSIRITLGGHEGPIYDLSRRLESLFAMHRERMEQILAMSDRGITIHEIAARLFAITEGYHRLLALEEAAAHVEYLYLRGFLCVENYQDLERDEPVPMLYRRTEVAEGSRSLIPCESNAPAIMPERTAQGGRARR